MTEMPTSGGSFSRDPATGKLSPQPEAVDPVAAPEPAPAAQPAPSPRRSTPKGGL